ncbi:MAG: PTH1 family peptidyl-tRNA hydrolase [Planctomycetota bacterium]
MLGKFRMIVGLGNPGDEYVGTRHNVGFAVLECLASEWGLFFESPRVLNGYEGPRKFSVLLKSDTAKSVATEGMSKTICVKPTTFMNLSGTVVAPLAKWAGLAPEEILVVYDDMDLPFGALRIRPHGGAGGHNGMKSIIDSLDSDRFPRLRVGIGRSGTDAARHVLERFDSKEQEEMNVVVAQAAEALEFWADGGTIEECMTRFHSRWNQASL